jgi:hypothetical protein
VTAAIDRESATPEPRKTGDAFATVEAPHDLLARQVTLILSRLIAAPHRPIRASDPPVRR